MQPETTKHVFEMWRRLRERYDKISDSAKMGLLRNILSFQFDVAKIEQQILKWEDMIVRYQRTTKTNIADRSRLAILNPNTTGELQSHLQLRKATRFAESLPTTPV